MPYVGSDDGSSHLYAFDLDGIDTTFAASGEVDGLIRDRWSMDESDGVLRVAVGPTGSTGNFNSLVTFRQEGNDLVEAGRLDDLGVDEQIQSVRWFDTPRDRGDLPPGRPALRDRPDRPRRAPS